MVRVSEKMECCCSELKFIRLKIEKIVILKPEANGPYKRWESFLCALSSTTGTRNHREREGERKMQRPRRRCEGTAMGAIVLDLRPGGGIGPFNLGTTLCFHYLLVPSFPIQYFTFIYQSPSIGSVSWGNPYFRARLRLTRLKEKGRVETVRVVCV